LKAVRRRKEGGASYFRGGRLGSGENSKIHEAFRQGRRKLRGKAQTLLKGRGKGKTLGETRVQKEEGRGI